MSGQRFGKLVLVKRVNKPGGAVHAVWECSCDCGNVIHANIGYLRSGKKTHCGCQGRKTREGAHDLTGQRFGRLVVVEKVGKRDRTLLWRCVCDCGNSNETTTWSLLGGHSNSCGCLRLELLTKHGDSRRDNKSEEYGIWNGMRNRCTNPNVAKYPIYGGRGIKVCERWKSYENFLSDMGRRPSSKHSIDRIDVNGDYEPGNCRWATPKEQANNKRFKAA